MQPVQHLTSLQIQLDMLQPKSKQSGATTGIHSQTLGMEPGHESSIPSGAFDQAGQKIVVMMQVVMMLVSNHKSAAFVRVVCVIWTWPAQPKPSLRLLSTPLRFVFPQTCGACLPGRRWLKGIAVAELKTGKPALSRFVLVLG